MKNKCKRHHGKFDWVPPHIRIPFPPRKPEKRKPLYWLARDGEDLYLVNDSDEILEEVTSSRGGPVTLDDEPVTPDGSNTDYSYDDVKPREAVKVDEFDPTIDSDLWLETSVIIESTKRGLMSFLSPTEKGGCKGDVVLLWDTEEEGRNVSMIKDGIGIPDIKLVNFYVNYSLNFWWRLWHYGPVHAFNPLELDRATMQELIRLKPHIKQALNDWPTNEEINKDLAKRGYNPDGTKKS